MSSLIVAKTGGCNVGERDKSTILESYKTFFIDKKSIIVVQLYTCGMLLKYTADEKKGGYSEGSKRELKLVLTILVYYEEFTGDTSTHTNSTVFES
jgi:hypothetical protein